MVVNMTFEGELHVEAPAQEVWDFLLDLEKVAGCVPGLQEARKDEEGCYRLVVKTKVGFITATVNLRGRILESHPPKMVRSEFRGMDKKLGSSLTQVNTLELVELGPSKTGVRYSSDVAFLGTLAMLGRRLMKAKASEIIEEFNGALKARIEATANGQRDR